MSSTAAVASGVSYHLASENLDSGSTYSSCSVLRTGTPNSDSVRNRCDADGSKNADKVQVPSSKLDMALKDSLKGYPQSTFNRALDYDSKHVNRVLSFHASTAPPLDSVIRQRIQCFPKHLILTDDKAKHDDSGSIRGSVLCDDSELKGFCRQSSNFVPRQSLGLSNTGNTCYLNSVLQCLLATGPLLSYVKQRHSSPNQCALLAAQSTSNKPRFCGLCGLARLLKEHNAQSNNNNNSGFHPSYTGSAQTVPSYFVCNVRAICPNLRPYQQEDAHEFLLGLLSRMEDSSVAGLGKLSNAVLQTNVVRRIFGSLIRSEVTCHSCKKVSARDEPCFNLSVDITCGRSLQQCLFNYIRNEELCGQNAYRCENCRQLRPALRRSTIFQGAPILIIQFNRFSRSQKLDNRVEFPASFNLRPFMTENKGTPVLYRLYATVNHEGYTCRSGHYIAFTRRHGSWFSHNDSFVNSTSLDFVLRQSPYLLFYEAVEPVNKPQQSVVTTQPQSLVQSPSISTLASRTNTSIPIPVSQIPLPCDSPPSSSKPNGLNPSPVPNAVNKQPPTSKPRIIFNQAVVGKLTQPSQSDPNKFSPPSLSTSSKNDTVSSVTRKPASSSTIRKLLYGDDTLPGLWTERPTPSLNVSPLEISIDGCTIDSPDTLSPAKRKHSTPSASPVPQKKRSPTNEFDQSRSGSSKYTTEKSSNGSLSLKMHSDRPKRKPHNSPTASNRSHSLTTKSFDPPYRNRENSGTVTLQSRVNDHHAREHRHHRHRSDSRHHRHGHYGHMKKHKHHYMNAKFNEYHQWNGYRTHSRKFR